MDVNPLRVLTYKGRGGRKEQGWQVGEEVAVGTGDSRVLAGGEAFGAPRRKVPICWSRVEEVTQLCFRDHPRAPASWALSHGHGANCICGMAAVPSVFSFTPLSH